MSCSPRDEFDDLFVRHQERVYAYIVVQLPNRNDADEVFQQTSLILLKKWEQYDADRPFFAWACGIAHNEVRNFLRRQRSGGVRLSDEMLALLGQTHQEMADGLQERLRALAGCLEQLPERQRTLIEQCYLGHETGRAVAERMQLTPDALYKRLERIRRLLFECIEHAVPGEE